ncbi:MAG: aminotransferase class I/II-fold pyridoxal phosphate-dependent enzyme, partial [Saprospiraceae bacterium]
ITTGASMGLFSTLATLDKGSNVLCPLPFYPPYYHYCKILGLEIKFYKLHERLGWKPDEAEIIDLIDVKTQGIIWNFPNNPTGSFIELNSFKTLLRLCQERILIIKDDVYEDFIYTESFTKKIKKYEIIVSIKKIKKKTGLSVERIGYIIATPNLLEKIMKVHWKLTMNSSLSSQLLVLNTLNKFSQNNQINNLIRQNRDTSYDILTKCEHLKLIIPEGGLFHWIKIKNTQIETEKLCKELMLKENILIQSGRAFGTEKNYIRCSFAIAPELITYTYSKLTNFFNEIL